MSKLGETISHYWHGIQGSLFPWLQEELGELTEKYKQLITVLEFSRLEEFTSNYLGRVVGRPQRIRCAIARAFVAKALYQLSTTRSLLDRLECDIKLRRICGLEKVADIPSESTFSRAFAEFSNSELPQRVHEALIMKYQSERLIGHISRDSTAIAGREKALKKEKAAEPAVPLKRGRPKKGEERAPPEPTRIEQQRTLPLQKMLAELPTACDIGAKRDSKGQVMYWKGYKLHLDVADGGVIISALLTSASLHDSQAAIPLMTLTGERVTSLYGLMDAAYDSEAIRAHCRSLGIVPLIDFNRRSKNDTRAFLPHEKKRYNERSTAERANSRIKDELGALMVRVRGHAKVMAHLMFGVIALTVDSLIRLVT